MTRLHSPLAALLTIALATAPLTGCSEPPGSEGEGEGNEGEGDTGEGEGEGGEGEGEGDIGDAEELCTIYTRGELKLLIGVLGAFSLGFSRCDAADVDAFGAELEAQIAQLAQDQCVPGAPFVVLFETALERGHVAFDMETIRDCAAIDFDLLSSTPDAQPEIPEECAHLTTGDLAEGGACIDHWECVDGLRCEHADFTSDELTCLPPAAVGEPCLPANSSDTITVNGGTARTCVETAACVDFECVARGGEGAVCTEDDACLEGLSCTGDTETPGNCVPPAADGGDCSDGRGCEEDLACVNDVCEPKVLDGRTCEVGDDCASICSVCRPTDAGGATLQCLDRGETGAGCASNEDCHKGFVCDLVGGACVVGGGENEACEVTDDCVVPLECASGLCGIVPELDDACTDTGPDCADGACIDGVCGFHALGDPCTFSCTTADDSEELVCVGGQCGPAPTSGPCSAEGVCAAGLLCVLGDLEDTCETPPAAGAPCVGVDLDQCGDDMFCDVDGDCQVLGLTGAVCTADTECVSGLCAQGACAPEAASCLGDPQLFPLIVIVSGVLVPIRLRRRISARK